jgi:hypothetical protein
MLPKVVSVRIELAKSDDTKELASEVEDIESQLNDMAETSQLVAEIINDSMDFENNLFSSPDTNQIADYEELNTEFFTAISDYKTMYDSLNASLNLVKQNIGLSESITLNNKTALTQNLSMPTQASKLSTFFNEIDSANQQMQEIFSSTNRTDTYVATLSTRIMMNDAWKLLYATDDEILEADSRFKTLEEAAENILSEENSTIWVNQDEVEALRLNWTQAESRYESTKYETAINSAKSAKKNVLAIIEDGVIIESNEIPQELIINAIIILLIGVAGLFIYEKILKKKKEDEETEYEQEY